MYFPLAQINATLSPLIETLRNIIYVS